MRYRFGQFVLDVTTHELRRGDELVPLWPKVFDFLRYLVEHPSRLVTKQELLDEVWADAHVAEGSIAWTVSHARRALGQGSGQKQPIETVHKRGYRFVADVEMIKPRPASRALSVGRELSVRAAQVLRPYPLMGGLDDPYTRGLLEEVLEHAPEGANELRVSALSQLAWTPPYSQDIARSKAMSAEALELARQLGDEALVLRALAARLHALSGPDDCDALLATANEMQALARKPRAWIVAAVLGARHAAHLHRGATSQADATLDALGRLSRARPWPYVTWIHDRLRVQAQIMRGELAEAATALDALRAHTERFNVPFGAEMQLVLEGLLVAETRGVHALRERTDLDLLRGGLSLAPIGLRPTIARVLLELGERDVAKAVLDELGASDFAKVPRDIGYLGALASLSMLAIRLEDRARAQQLYALLAPYPRHNTLNLLSLHEGSVSHFLGMLAAHLGMDHVVERHFEDALAMNERNGLRPQLSRTRDQYDRWSST